MDTAPRKLAYTSPPRLFTPASQSSAPSTIQPAYDLFAPNDGNPMPGSLLKAHAESTYLWNHQRAPKREPLKLNLPVKHPRPISWLYPNGDVLDQHRGQPVSHDNSAVLQKLINKKNFYAGITQENTPFSRQSTVSRKKHVEYADNFSVKSVNETNSSLTRSSNGSQIGSEAFEVLIIYYALEESRIVLEVTKKTHIYEQVAHYLSLSEPQFSLHCKGKILGKYNTVGRSGIRSLDEIYVVLTPKALPASENRLAPSEIVPQLTKPGYSLSPRLITLARMTADELRRVENFTVENSYGKIVFIGLVDVTCIDLDSAVHIDEGEIRVVAETGEERKLNRPAQIHLFACFPETNSARGTFEGKLRQECLNNGHDFIRWDGQSGEWVFQVHHF